MLAGVRARWRSILDHPILRLELRRIRRKRWWPGRRFFLFYPALLGVVLGCGAMLALTDSLGVQVLALAVGLLLAFLVGVVAWLFGFALPWIAPALTATTIARERELGTLDLLQVTLLTDRSIVLGKLGGCLAWLWPGILVLLLLSPIQIARVTVSGGGSLFGFSYLPVLMAAPPGDTDLWWVWVLLGGVAGWLRGWGDLALHMAIGLFVSTLVRFSGMAVAVSYGVILAARAALWLGRSLLFPLLIVSRAGSMGSVAAPSDIGYLFPVSVLAPLAIASIEAVLALLLVQGAVWRLKRM